MTRLSTLLRVNLIALLSLPLAAFSPIAMFGTLVPKDGGVDVVTDIAYGGDPRHKLDIYRPQNAAGGPLPVVFFIYGGSWNSGDKAHYAFVGRALAAQGFVTVVSDYRLVPDVVYPDFVSDNSLALAWVAERIGQYGGDRDRMFVAGHSAGAYNGVMLALDPQYRRDLPDHTILGVAGLSGPYDFLPLDADASINAFGSFDDLPATQPVNYASADAPPMLLLHGSADDLVYPRNTTALAQALSDAGGQVEMKIYDGVDHGGTLISIARPLRWRLPVLEDMVGFFRRQLDQARG